MPLSKVGSAHTGLDFGSSVLSLNKLCLNKFQFSLHNLESGQPSLPGEREKFGVIPSFLHPYCITFLGTLSVSQDTWPMLSCASQ